MILHELRARLLLAALTIAVAGTACGVDVEGDDPQLDEIHYPVGATLHPEGRFLYVVNSNFDLKYREDRGGTVIAIDTDTMKLVPSSSVQIGTFGGDIRLNNVAGEATRAFVAVRGNQSVTALDIVGNGGSLRCNGGRRTKDCELPTESGDPFGLAVSTMSMDDAEGNTDYVDFVAVAHLTGGNITSFTVKGQGAQRSFSRVSSPLVSGANAIEQSPRNGHFYATSRFTNSIVSFRPSIEPNGDVAAIFQTDEILVRNAAPSGGLDSRGIAFNHEGTMAYVANRGPDALLFIDVGPTDVSSGTGTRNEIVDTLTLPDSPAEVEYITVDGRDFIYVSSYEEKQIVVIDPVTRLIVDTIDIPGNPYTMVVDQVRHQRLYVTLFDKHAVAAIDLDPASPSFNRVSAVVR